MLPCACFNAGAGNTIFMTEEKNNKKINQDALKWVILGLAGFAAIVLIFAAGIIVGGMKAKFSYEWAENYHKNFGGPKAGFLSNWRNTPPLPGEFIEGHGAFGEIIQINDNGFVIKGRSNVEKIIITAEDTIIKKGTETIENNLEVGEYIVIIGSPNAEGQIEAKLIRVFDKELKPSPMPKKGFRHPFL